MTLDYATLDHLRQTHPAWRLLRADHAPLVIAFLNRVFVSSKARSIAEADLVEALEDELFTLRAAQGESFFPKPARDYLKDWAAPDKGWMRKYYPSGSDDPHYDLMPATEKAIAWLASLSTRAFVGTESRLLTLFELLRQMSEGAETNPAARLEELHRRRDEIDAQISQIQEGDVPLMEGGALRDRFLQFTQIAQELLGDFRQVEANFRQLDRGVRERITLWEGSKGALLEEIMGERDVIADSDQGRSFHAFWDFLMSSRRQEELTRRLDQVLGLPALEELAPDPRLRRVHYDWLEAGEHTQRTVAELSRQLRRFLDDQAWLENRRIMDLLHGIESKALGVRHFPPAGAAFMEIPDSRAGIDLPMERPMHRPTFKPTLLDTVLAASGDDIDAAALFGQHVVDRAALAENIRRSLHSDAQLSLRTLIDHFPLEHGVAELVAYLDLGSTQFHTTVDESVQDIVRWQVRDPDGSVTEKSARMARVIFVK